MTLVVSFNSINFFFANYKLAVSKNVRSFSLPFSSSVLKLLDLFKQEGIIYSYTFDKTYKLLRIYPRYSKRFSNFQIWPDSTNFLSVFKLKKLRNSGYSYIIFNPYLKKAFFSNNCLLYNSIPGILLLKW
jgi:hypothetical protein